MVAQLANKTRGSDSANAITKDNYFHTMYLASAKTPHLFKPKVLRDL
jgi:hypothetical protein